MGCCQPQGGLWGSPEILHAPKKGRRQAACGRQNGEGAGRGGERRELVADWADQRRSAKSTAQRVVQGALGLYSSAAKRAAQRHNMLRLPHTAFARIATAPMRRYSDLVAQRQLTSALCMQPGMPSAEVAVIDRWIKQRQADLDKAEAAVSKGELLKPYQRRSS